MSLVERALDLGQSAIVAIVGGISGGIFWIVRNVLTNKRDNDLLRNELKSVKDGLNRIESILISSALQGKEK